MATLETLVHRLIDPTAGPRRIAILDLIRLSPTDARATQALLTHLPSEIDEKSALAIIRHFAAIGHILARPTLWQLYENQSTPARIAHAAIIAHDTLSK